MHEVSIAESILDLLERQIGSAQPLLEVEVQIGPLSGVSPQSLSFCFTTVASARGFGTPTLLIQQTTVKIQCRSCMSIYSSEERIHECPHCNSWEHNILSGDELLLVSASLMEATHV